MTQEVRGSHGQDVATPVIHEGRLTVRTTEVTVEQVLRRLMETLDVERVLETFPGLSREDVRAVLAYAHERLESSVHDRTEDSISPQNFYAEMTRRPDVSELLRRLSR